MKTRVSIWDALWLIVPVLMISMASYMSPEVPCTQVVVTLLDVNQNHFLVEEDVEADLERLVGRKLVGGKLIHNHLNQMEKHLKSNKFVHHAEVLSDHKGRLLVDVIQERPLARIITNDSTYYVVESGKVMPTSLNYSARVMVILGDKINEILSPDTLPEYTRKDEFVEFLKYVSQDKFLKAQVQTIEVLDNEKILIYPQVTSQNIMFGRCVDIVDKFERLKIFYKQILPRKGWNNYNKVSLEFKNQIICE